MSDFYKETRKTSYGGNLINSIKNIGFGILLFILSFIILWGNEWYSMRQIKKTDFIQKNAVEVSSDLKIDRANDNKLIATNGKATTENSLSDGIITLKNALAIERKVEMYQWQEHEETETKDEIGGGTTEVKTYTYEQVWDDKEINSSRFHESGHSNPRFPVESQRINISSGKFGAFTLTSKQTAGIDKLKPLRNLPKNENYKNDSEYYYKLYSNIYNPKIGDIRISYKYAPSGTDISVIGQQKSNNTIDKMPTKIGNIYLQYDGLFSKKQMLEKFRTLNSAITNILRLVGFIVMLIGLLMATDLLVTIFKVIPFLSSIASTITLISSFLISVVLSLLTIGVAWIFYRPLYALILFAIAFLIIFLLERHANNKKLNNFKNNY